MTNSGEIFISIDIEASGPYPGRYSLLSIGACLVDDPAQDFYAELKPVSLEAVESALRVSHFSLEALSETGLDPRAAMQSFAAWIHKLAPRPRRAIMVGFNAPYDWAFIDHYFGEYLGENPFGHTALDIKAFYMGLTGCAWDETSMVMLSPRFLKGDGLPHHALEDARMQAELFRQLLAQARHTSKKEIER